jgi:hypothetical protein
MEDLDPLGISQMRRFRRGGWTNRRDLAAHVSCRRWRPPPAVFALLCVCFATSETLNSLSLPHQKQSADPVKDGYLRLGDAAKSAGWWSQRTAQRQTAIARRLKEGMNPVEAIFAEPPK